MFETIPKIRIFINLLLILEICLGLALIAFTWYYQRVLATFLTETEDKMLTSKFFNVYILGFQLMASFFCGMSVWASVWPRRYTENIQLLLSMWVIFCFLFVSCGCATIWTLWTSVDTLSEGAEIILLKGIDIYYMDPEWKLLWDKMQYTKECCGVLNYQDWMKATWMKESLNSYSENHYGAVQHETTECSPTYMDVEYSDFDSLAANRLDNQQQILAPYACCKRNSVFCYENYMPRLGRTSETIRLPHLNLTEINTDGCFPVFTRHLIILINTLFILILIALIVDIIICCLTKYLMATNYKRCYREYHNDLCMFDDEGNALVVIKCPPKVRCITLEEPNTFSGSDIPNILSSADFCPCCNNDNDVEVPEGVETNKKTNSSIVH